MADVLRENRTAILAAAEAVGARNVRVFGSVARGDDTPDSDVDLLVDFPAAEIARRAKVTGSSVRYWVSGARGPGGFPEPAVRRQRASLYSWAEVSRWLAAARLGEVDHLAAETARACVLVGAALTVRYGLRELPRHDRPLIARLVA